MKDTNTVPDCSITDPADGSSGGQGDLVVFRGEASDPDIPSSDLTALFFKPDGELGAVTPTSDGIIEFPHQTSPQAHTRSA